MTDEAAALPINYLSQGDDDMSTTLLTDERATSQPVHAAPRHRNRGARVGAAGLAVAVALLGLGAVMKSNASFAEDNVNRQLAEQRITFKPAEALTPDERAKPCLVRYAGQRLTTGAQAECYANHFIGTHLKSIAGGKTYSEMREVQTTLRSQIDRAQAAGDPAVADFQRQLAEANGKKQALLEGESVRGLLLTSYGFSTLGSKAGEAATVANLAGGAMLVLSLVVLASAASRRSRSSRS